MKQTTTPQINSEMAVRMLVDDGNLCGEAPLWDADKQKTYWTDSVGKLFSYDWRTKRREIILPDFEVTGCALDESGGLTLVNNSGVWAWNGTDKPICIANESNGAKLQLNDCIADSQGRLLTGSCFYNSKGQYPLGKLFCVENDGVVRILDEGFHLANGLGFSSDGKILYFTDSATRSIYAYTYDSTTGQVRDRRIFVKVDSNGGIPDGLTVDAEDFVWSAEWYGSCVARYDPTGKLERRVSVPAKQTSSLAFGGPELLDIFITSAAQSEPTPMMPPRYDPNNGYFGGALFHCNLGIKGRLEHRTRMKSPGR